MTSKRLLVLAPSCFPDEPGGSARLTFDLVTDLARNGHEGWYLCQTRNSDWPEYAYQAGLHVLKNSLSNERRFDVLRAFKHFSAVRELLTRYLPEPPAIVHGHDLLPYVSAIKFYGDQGKSFYTIHSPAVKELAIVWRAQGLSGYIKLLMGLPLIWFLLLPVSFAYISLIIADCESPKPFLSCDGWPSGKNLGSGG